MLRVGWAIFLTVAMGVAGVMGFKMMTGSDEVFTTTVTIDRRAGDVWRALTRKADVDRYYLAPLGADITAAGDDLFYGTAAQKMIVGTVVTFEAPLELSHTFRFADSGDATGSRVTYRLDAIGDTTRVSVEHRGYPADSQHFADISMGWPIILNGLKTHLEARAAAETR